MSIHTAARRSLAAIALVAGSAAAAHAQQYTVVYNGSTTNATITSAVAPNPTYAVGPVSETISGPYIPGGMITLKDYCVDFQNTISGGATYRANITSLGAVLGGMQTLANARHTTAADLVNYQKAAFLIDQFTQFDTEAQATRNAHYAALQGALWALFTPSAVTLDASTSTTNNTVIEYWQKQANDFAASSRFATYDYSRFYIITDVNAAGKATGGVQEFMGASTTVTPEPGSYAMLGLGLVGTLVAVRRRRVA